MVKNFNSIDQTPTPSIFHQKELRVQIEQSDLIRIQNKNRNQLTYIKVM